MRGPGPGPLAQYNKMYCMGRTIAVLGGGVAGLSAAHHLSVDAHGQPRDVEIHVYEKGRRGALGGKATSQWLPGTGQDGRRDLPGEHGFRFYPSFYRHVVDTMGGIPAGDGNSVADHLHCTPQAAAAVGHDVGLQVFERCPTEQITSLVKTIQFFFKDMDVTGRDIYRYARQILKFVTSCDERRNSEYEDETWWEFLRVVDAQGRDTGLYTDQFKKYLYATTRTMAAMDAKRCSARTIGATSVQLLRDFASRSCDNDRTLAGPTSQYWLEPWVDLLETRGVQFHTESPVKELLVEGNRVVGARIAGQDNPIIADEFILAVPLEVAHPLIRGNPELRAADPQLENFAANADPSEMTAWMVGAQFFLDRDIPVCQGHIFYPGSPWALTAISQAQFWREEPGGQARPALQERYGNGAVKGILSVDVSDWLHQAAPRLGCLARECTREQALDEIWAQVKDGLNPSDGPPLLTDDMLVARHLDTGIEDLPGQDGSGASRVSNATPLLIHPVGSHRVRPRPVTALENFYLASDYVQTNTDVASMEAADEAARRVVNCIVERGGEQPDCKIWNLFEDEEFEIAKRRDRRRFLAGKPHIFDFWRGSRASRSRPRAGWFVGPSRTISSKDLLCGLFDGVGLLQSMVGGTLELLSGTGADVDHTPQLNWLDWVEHRLLSWADR